MKFLIIASYPDSILRFRGALIQAIQDKGFEIHIVAPNLRDAPEVRQQLETLGYIVHDIFMQRTGVNILADAKTLRQLYILIRNLQPDYVMGYTIKPVIYGSIAAHYAKVPHRFALITGLGYTFQSIEPGQSRVSLFQKLIHWLYAYALKRVDVTFFQNSDDRTLFYQLGLLKEGAKSVVVNGSGVNILDYSITPIPYNDQQEIVMHFLLIARLLIDKGVREFAAAAKRIKAQYPHAQFSLVGWIDDNPNAIHQSELDEWVRGGYIEFLGKLMDVRPAIAESSVYVLPSYREGVPCTVLEAMAMARPVITTDAPGCRETVENGYNGFLVPIKSVDALVKAMEKFIAQPSLVTTMGTSARKMAEEKFDVHSVNQMMLKEMGL
ncbi:MAG: glycosyltransferase family 4 protein [Gammaproteobacteria bacterium]|nr:glycosyltransferase family 4 protein [Gammaproteobacteria bacterium]